MVSAKEIFFAPGRKPLPNQQERDGGFNQLLPGICCLFSETVNIAKVTTARYLNDVTV